MELQAEEAFRNQEFGAILSFMYLWAIQMEMLSIPFNEQVWSSEERSCLERSILGLEFYRY